VAVLAYYPNFEGTVVGQINDYIGYGPLTYDYNIQNLIQLDTADLGFEEFRPWLINWSAWIQLEDFAQTPTRYESALPKYKLGQWNTTLGGFVTGEGYVNYFTQALCAGSCAYTLSTWRNYGLNIYTPSAPGQVENIYNVLSTTVNNSNSSLGLADGLYLNIIVPCLINVTINYTLGVYEYQSTTTNFFNTL